MPLDPETYLAHLRADVDVLAAVAGDGLDARVPACPDWSVAQLLGHTAGVFRFATAQLLAGPVDSMVKFDPPPEGDPVEVFRDCAAELLDAFARTDPSEPRPNWVDSPTADWWWRRMAQEAVVHRVDAELAVRGARSVVDTALAIDGVDEFADNYLVHAHRRGITGTGETVHLHATGEDVASGTGEWMFTFTPEGVAVTHEHGKGDMAGRGAPADLLLFVWNRRPVELECFGDPDLLTWWPATVAI